MSSFSEKAIICLEMIRTQATWRLSLDKRMVVYHSELTVLRCSSGTNATRQVFPKKHVTFAWRRFVRKQLLLDLTRLETPIQSTAAYFRTHTRNSNIRYLSRCRSRVFKHRDCIFVAFLSTNRHEPFFEQLTNYVGYNGNKFL